MNNPVVGIPLSFANPKSYKLKKCRTLGCKTLICNDMAYCGIHSCLVKSCNNSHMASSSFCGYHWWQKEEDYKYRDWEKI